MNNNTEIKDKDQVNVVSPTAKLIFERIEAESITPASRLSFLLSEGGIWLLWLVTVIFGAIALAVSSYVTLSAQYAFYEATHENFLTFFVAGMPYVWVTLFALMTYIAVFEIKKTKNGYRYNTLFIVGSNLLGTVIGAVLLHQMGMGYAFDKKLGEQIDMYMSMDKMEQKMWQKPQDGRLIGELIEDVTSEVKFRDNSGVLWELSLSELTPRETIILQTGIPVRLIGTSTNQGIFHVCGVFFQTKGRARAWQEMDEERQEFFTTMHARRSMLANEISDSEVKIVNNAEDKQLCAHLEMMKRIR